MTPKPRPSDGLSIERASDPTAPLSLFLKIWKSARSLALARHIEQRSEALDQSPSPSIEFFSERETSP